MSMPAPHDRPQLDASTLEQLEGMLCRSLDDSTTSLQRARPIDPDNWGKQPLDAHKLVLLSLSSYHFHSLVVLVADPSQATCSITDDQLLEMGNTFCGSLKRQLGQHLPSLGMSTPHALSIHCLPVLLGNGQPPLIAGCHDSRGLALTGWLLLPDNFTVQLVARPLAETADTGELELF